MLVANMSSSTVQAPRNLSQALVRRLDEIAIGPGGQVLIHSRLFAQWMHQAFPRECPYPHLVGTTTSLGPQAWAKQNGQKYSIGRKHTLKIHIQTLELAEEHTDDDSSGADADLMWTSEEEHFIEPTRSFSATFWASFGTLAPGFMLLVLFAGLAF